MFHSVAQLLESRVIGCDGIAGRVVDAYFDERSWQIRYLLLEIAGARSKRALMCPPESVVRIDEVEGELFVGQMPGGKNIPPEPGSSLRSSREIIGCAVSGWSGEIGLAEDAVFETESWGLQFLLVNPGNRPPGGIVFVDSALIDEAHWEEQRLRVALTDVEVLEECERDGLTEGAVAPRPALH